MIKNILKKTLLCVSEKGDCMGKFVLIGGGECGRPGTVYETEVIDKEIISLTGKSKPNYLLIALASLKPELYYYVMRNVYEDIHECYTDQILMSDLEDYEILKKKIEWADIIYVGGGDTLKLMKSMRKYKMDQLLKEAYDNGKVLCGVSAGAICWCDYGNSDSRKITSDSENMIRVKGLGFLPVLLCPHYDVESYRKPSLKEMMKRTYKMPAIALDNGAALEVVDGEFRIITCFDWSTATKCYWKKSDYIEEKFQYGKQYNIEELYRR